MSTPDAITQPGIYPGFPVADYFADPCPVPSLTQSVAKILLERSPLHAWHAHPRLRKAAPEPEDYTAAHAIGNAAHKLLLERGKDIAVIDVDSWRTKAAQEQRDAAAAAGHVPILEKHFGRAQAMVRVAREVLATFALAEFGGDTEAVIAWQEGGCWFRSMIDKLSTSRTIVLDFKTSGMCCAPAGLGRMMVDAGWDVQAAMHERGLDVLAPASAGRRRHLFVAQENEAPYAVTVAELDEGALTIGRKKLQAAVDIWRRCIEADRWPGYPLEIARPEYPPWLEVQWLERETVEAAHARLPGNASNTFNPELIMAG